MAAASGTGFWRLGRVLGGREVDAGLVGMRVVDEPALDIGDVLDVRGFIVDGRMVGALAVDRRVDASVVFVVPALVDAAVLGVVLAVDWRVVPADDGFGGGEVLPIRIVAGRVVLWVGDDGGEGVTVLVAVISFGVVQGAGARVGAATTPGGLAAVVTIGTGGFPGVAIPAIIALISAGGSLVVAGAGSIDGTVGGFWLHTRLARTKTTISEKSMSKVFTDRLPFFRLLHH